MSIYMQIRGKLNIGVISMLVSAICQVGSNYLIERGETITVKYNEYWYRLVVYELAWKWL